MIETSKRNRIVRLILLAIVGVVAFGNALGWTSGSNIVPFVCVIALLSLRLRGPELESWIFLVSDVASVLCFALANALGSREQIWGVSVAIALLGVAKSVLSDGSQPQVDTHPRQ